MKSTLEIHPTQAKVLRKLLFNPEARFSQLNVDGISTDQFNFHVKSLVGCKLLEKTGNGKYVLTLAGKEFANRFDTDRMVIEKQGKIGVVVYCIKREGKSKKYLVQQRLKQPYYGYYGGVTGKVRWGERIEDTATREFKEETGLDVKVKLMYVRHKMDYSQENVLLDDKIFFVFKAEVTGGRLIEQFDGGRNAWLNIEEIKKLPKVFDGFDRTMHILNRRGLHFLENQYTVSNF